MVILIYRENQFFLVSEGTGFPDLNADLSACISDMSMKRKKIIKIFHVLHLRSSETCHYVLIWDHLHALFQLLILHLMCLKAQRKF